METLAMDSLCSLTDPQPYQRDGAEPPLAATSFAFTSSFITHPSAFQYGGQRLAPAIGYAASSSFGSQRSNVSINVHEHARRHGLRADESEFARVGTVRKEAFAPA